MCSTFLSTAHGSVGLHGNLRKNLHLHLFHVLSWFQTSLPLTHHIVQKSPLRRQCGKRQASLKVTLTLVFATRLEICSSLKNCLLLLYYQFFYFLFIYLFLLFSRDGEYLKNSTEKMRCYITLWFYGVISLFRWVELLSEVYLITIPETGVLGMACLGQISTNAVRYCTWNKWHPVVWPILIGNTLRTLPEKYDPNPG